MIFISHKSLLLAICLLMFQGLVIGKTALVKVDFEEGIPETLTINKILFGDKGKRLRVPENTITEKLQSENVYSGKQALLLESSLAKGRHEIVCAAKNLPLQSGTKYELCFSYFIDQKGAGSRVSVRIVFFDENGKAIRNLFPEGDNTPGKWHLFKQEFYPPSNAVSMAVTLWFIGEYRVFLDDLSINEALEDSIIETGAGTALLGTFSEGLIWKEANYLRVPFRGVPPQLEKRPLQLTAAANEREPFQLVISPEKEVKNITLDFSELTATNGQMIAASAFNWQPVGFIQLHNPDNPTLKGWHADPLLYDKNVNAPAEHNTPLWIMLHVPGNAMPGIYHGVIRVKSGENELAAIPLEVKVRSFRLPDNPALKTFFYANSMQIKNNYQDSRSSKEVVNDITAILHEHRITGNQAYRLMPKWRLENGQLQITDWSNFDAVVSQHSQQYGIRLFCIGGLGMFGDCRNWFSDIRVFGQKPLSEEGLRLLGDYARLVMEHVKTKFPDLHFYSYTYDEPQDKNWPEIKRIIDRLKETAPDLKIFLTSKIRENSPEVDVWCSSPGSDPLAKRLAEVANGKEIWLYNWSIHLDKHNYLKNRLYSWLVYANGGNGALLWNIAFTPAQINPWDNIEKTYQTGAATLIYPAQKPGERFYTSQRFAQVREAIDDFDYFTILESGIEQKFPGYGKRRVKEILQQIIPTLPIGYVNNPHLLYTLRDRIGDEIDQLNDDPVSLVVSDPSENAIVDTSRIDFTILGPDGASVTIDGRQAGVIDKGKLMFSVEMAKIGLNEFSISVSANGKTRSFQRSYELKPDPQLAELDKLRSECNSVRIDTAEINIFLDELKKQSYYREENRLKAARLLTEFQNLLLQEQLRRPFKETTLTKAVNKQAHWAFREKLFERSRYYLKLRSQAEKVTLTDQSVLKLDPVMLEGHFGFRLKNQFIEAIILETGGRIVSLKVNGVECFASGELKKSLPPVLRASQQFDKIKENEVPPLRGYEDASITVLPESAFDWNLSLTEVSQDRIAITASVLLQNNVFRLERTMELRRNSMELVLDYRISNVTSPDFSDDDPASYQFSWRGRVQPAIGANREKDTIVVPTDEKIPSTCFSTDNPVFFELRSIRLNAPYLGVFNPERKTGLALMLDKQLNYSYLWMNSKGNRDGSGKTYTLEVFRSFYGNKHDYREKNTPFSIKPGETCKFRIRLVGLPGINNQSDFVRDILSASNTGL